MTGRKAGITTLLLKEINNNGKTLSFVYDAVGNITTISENGVQKVKYTYNALSELTRVDSAWENKSITYTYDAGMNMTSRKEYSYTWHCGKDRCVYLPHFRVERSTYFL